MCTSVVPLRCHVASNTPHLPHLCCTSLSEFITYGIHPKQQRQQRPAPQALSFISLQSTSSVTFKSTYCVVLPVSNATLVIALWPHAGQSAGAGPRPKLAIGVTLWYTVPLCCWGGMPGIGPAVCWGCMYAPAGCWGGGEPWGNCSGGGLP